MEKSQSRQRAQALGLFNRKTLLYNKKRNKKRNIFKMRQTGAGNRYGFESHRRH